MKKVILLIALLLALSVPVFAAGQLLVDDADILTSAEERRLERSWKKHPKPAIWILPLLP